MKQKKQTGSFVEGKGYYIVLFLCAIAIGISGYYLFAGLSAQPDGFGSEVSSAVSGRAELETEAAPWQEQPAGKPLEEQTDEGDTKAEETTEAVESAPETDAETESSAVRTEESGPSELMFGWPVDGTVDRDFSLEVFAYDATMGDWRTHTGLDIAAEVGAPVSACGKGTVETVTADDMLGVMVVVDHGQGLKSIYANLADPVSIHEGEAVVHGTILGQIGTTAVSESAAPSHLHFAMEENGVAVDPMNYLEESY